MSEFNKTQQLKNYKSLSSFSKTAGKISSLQNALVSQISGNSKKTNEFFKASTYHHYQPSGERLPARPFIYSKQTKKEPLVLAPTEMVFMRI